MYKNEHIKMKFKIQQNYEYLKYMKPSRGLKNMKTLETVA